MGLTSMSRHRDVFGEAAGVRQLQGQGHGPVGGEVT